MPMACDFEDAFDRDDPRWHRLHLPEDSFTVDVSALELKINHLRTHQGQSDVFVINRRMPSS